jgi:adenylate kinase
VGTGLVHGISFEEALLLKDTDQYTLDLLSINLPTESIYVNELNVTWRYETGLVENISSVVHEYKEKRGLHPLRILVNGPPVSGKTTLSEQLAAYYGLHHINLKELVQNAELVTTDFVNILTLYRMKKKPRWKKKTREKRTQRR